MRKHIFGFALFSLIVGISIAVYSFLFAPHRSQVIVSQTDSRTFEKDLEIGEVESRMFLISQATLNPEKKDFKVEILTNYRRNSGLHVQLPMYFFTVDESGTKYLGYWAPIFRPDSQNNRTLVTDWSFDVDWLKRLKPTDNLYVTVERESYGSPEGLKAEPNLDIALAKPVLISTDKKK